VILLCIYHTAMRRPSLAGLCVVLLLLLQYRLSVCWHQMNKPALRAGGGI